MLSSAHNRRRTNNGGTLSKYRIHSADFYDVGLRMGLNVLGCVVLPTNHPMTEEPHSLPHTPYAVSPTRLFGRQRRPLSQPDRDPPVYVALTNNGSNGDASRKCTSWRHHRPCVHTGYSFALPGTQEDQDATDEVARKQAMNELVQSWMDRLQLISVIVRPFSPLSPEEPNPYPPPEHRPRSSPQSKRSSSAPRRPTTPRRTR